MLLELYNLNVVQSCFLLNRFPYLSIYFACFMGRSFLYNIAYLLLEFGCIILACFIKRIHHIGLNLLMHFRLSTLVFFILFKLRNHFPLTWNLSWLNLLRETFLSSPILSISTSTLVTQGTSNLLLHLDNRCFSILRANNYPKQGISQLHVIQCFLYSSDAQLTYIKLCINNTVEACLAADDLSIRSWIAAVLTCFYVYPL